MVTSPCKQENNHRFRAYRLKIACCHIEYCPSANGRSKRGCKMKSIHLPKDTGSLSSARSEILRLRPADFAQNDRYSPSL